MSCYWLGGLHTPDSLLTALIQVTSRKKMVALDKLVLFTEVTDKTAAAQIESTLEHGAYIEGMFIEVTQNTISDSTFSSFVFFGL